MGYLNRHGLIAGATGTGKTRTLQLIAEQVSAAGCPVFAADMKGDLAGIGAAGTADDRLTARATELDAHWAAAACPVELLSLTGQDGVADPRHGHRVRPDAVLQGARAQRDPGVRASA